MVSRMMDMERKTLLVQFIAVDPLAFYATADGTDLVQDILKSRLARSDADIFGQEGSLTIDDHGEFLLFEPTDLKNRTLHLPVEHLAYCGALRRLRHDSNEQQQRDPNNIFRREFENVDLANRFPHLIIGPPIFVAVFHGFENAMCYTFITQSSEDACLLVMKLMRAFKIYEQKFEHQGQTNQGFSPYPSRHDGRSPSPIGIRQASPLTNQAQPFLTDNRQIGGSTDFVSPIHSTVHSYNQDPRRDELIQRILANPNLQLVNEPSSFVSQNINDIPILSSQPMLNRISPYPMQNQIAPSMNIPYMGQTISPTIRPPSPPVLGVPNSHAIQNFPLTNENPQVIYKQSNQEVVYKQNIMVRWLQPPTPPPPAPIIIREVQAPAEVQPPIICRQVPPCPPTPPPIIVREKPPPCPPVGQPLIIEKRIPGPVLPRQVIVERYPAPPSKPPTIIYEKYLAPPKQPRQVIVKREVCPPNGCAVVQQQQHHHHHHTGSGPRLVREIVRQIPQTAATAQPAMVCVPQQHQQTTVQQQAVQQMVPVYATRQHIVQPQGVRVIRQVVGPATPTASSAQQVYSGNGSAFVQAVPQTILQ